MPLIVLPPKAPGAAARHRPRDLRPGPRLRHRAGAVVDLAEHDLARLARPGLHDPLVRRRPVLGVRLRLRRVAVEPVGDLRRSAKRIAVACSSVSRAAPGGRGERRLDEPAVLVVDGLGRAAVGRRRRASASAASATASGR